MLHHIDWKKDYSGCVPRGMVVSSRANYDSQNKKRKSEVKKKTKQKGEKRYVIAQGRLM